MATARGLHYDYAEYLAALAASSLKLEYCDGVIYAMAGGTLAHAQLAASMIVSLRMALPKGCLISTSDLKVRIEETDLSTFPDVSIVCGDAKASPLDPNALVNPTLLVEVTSKSTEDYDRGDKLSHYKQIGSLRAVIFVSHRTRRITVVSRTDAGWSEHDYRGGETAALPVHDATFAVDTVYDGIRLDVA